MCFYAYSKKCPLFSGNFCPFCTWNFDYLRNSTNTFCQRIFSEIDRIFQGIWYLTSILRTSYKQYMSPTGNKLVLKQLTFYVKNRTGKNSVIDFFKRQTRFLHHLWILSSKLHTVGFSVPFWTYRLYRFDHYWIYHWNCFTAQFLWKLRKEFWSKLY